MALAVPAASYNSWRPTIFDAYILRTLARPAIACLAITLVAFLLEQALRLINELASHGAHMGYLFSLLTNLIPYHLGLALPASFFVAIFIVIARMDEDSEIDAILAGGVSFDRMVAPLVAAGVVLAIVNILLTGFLQPYSRFSERAVRNAALEAGWTAQLDPQVFMSAGPDFTITADEVDATGRGLTGVFIRRTGDKGETIITAAHGELGLRPDGKTTELRLDGGLVYSEGANGAPRLLRFSKVTDVETLSGPAKLQPRGGVASELTMPELLTELNRPDAMIPRRQLEAELYARLARALAVPILPLVAFPLALAAKRGRRAPGMIVGSVALIAYHHMINLTYSFSEGGHGSPLLLIGGGSLFMCGLGVWLFLASRRRPGETPINAIFQRLELLFGGRAKPRPAATQRSGPMSLSLYIGRMMATRTAIALAALMGFLQLIHLLDRTKDILARGTVLDIGRYALLEAPSMFLQTAGIAVLAGALFTFTELARNSELVVMRATGLSIWQILRRALPVALVVAAVYLVVADQVTPKAEQALATWWAATAPDRATKAPEPRWFRVGSDVVVAQSASDDGRTLTGVSIYQRDAEKALQRRLTAATATPEAGGWRLHDAVVTDLGRDRADTWKLGEADWRTSLRPDDAARLFTDSYQISSGAALRSLVGTGPTDRSPSQFKTRLQRTLAACAAPIVMLLLALPTALGHTRSNRTWPVIFGVLAGMLYLVVDGILTATGERGVLPPILAAWGAPAIFGAGAISLLLYAE